MNKKILAVLFFVMLLSVVLSNENDDSKGKLSGITILMIIAKSDFRDEELLVPKSVFEKEKAKVVIASTTRSEIKGMLGATVKPDILLNEVSVEDYDAVIFVGGSGSQQYFDDQSAHTVASDADEKGKILGAICLAPNILANAGVLKDKKCTCWGNPNNLKDNGANYTGKSVEKDGKIITANGPAAAKEFAGTIIKALLENR